MGSRPQRRSWTLAGVAAIGVALLAPADALGARGFKVGSPNLGDMSVARVELRAAGTAELAGMRVGNARRLPRNVLVAGRLSRVGRSKRYIARVFVLRSDPARRAGAAQDGVPGVDFEVVGGRVLVIRRTARVNVISRPNIPPECFGGESQRDWRGLEPMVDRQGAFRRSLRGFTRELLCGLPVEESFPEDFGTLEPAPVFGGVHGPFNGSRFEHVFQIHGNEDAGGLSINPPAGGAFTNCAGAPCLISDGRLLVVGPVRAGQDVEVNGRLNVEVPRMLTGDAYPGNSTGLFEGPPRRYEIGNRFRF